MSTTTHNWRGYVIVKHDTGGRRMGREVTYRVTLNDERVHNACSLRSAKLWIDVQLNTTDEERAQRDAFAAAILNGEK